MLTGRIRRRLTARADEGASAVEYGLLVAAIAAVIVTIVFLLGTQVLKAFQTTCDNVKSGGQSSAQTC